MDKSSSAKCLLYSDVVKGEPSPTGRGRRSRDEKGNQGVGDIRFTNILQLFSIYFFFSITLLYHFFLYFFYLRHLPTPTPTPTPTTHDLYPRPLPTTHDPRHLATLLFTFLFSFPPETPHTQARYSLLGTLR